MTAGMGALLLVLALGFLVTVLLPIAAFVRASRALDALERLERRLRSLEELTGRPAQPAPPVEAGAPAAATTAPPPLEATEPSPVGVPAEPATPAPAPSPSAAAPAAAESLETRIGSRWMLYVGVAALVIGVSYFIKHAFENEWITETMRVVIGGLAGAGLVGAGGWFVRSGYALYGQIVAGGGVAILYLSVYAAFNFYALVGRPTAFGLMALVTIAAAALADRHRSQALAIMAVGGGFLTPFMVGGETDAQVALFTYDAILVAGTMFLARTRAWPALNLVSYAFTCITVTSWAVTFYAPSKYLSTELFLTVFCAMFVVILRETKRSAHPLAGPASAALATAPVLYYFASIAILFRHAAALLIFFIALSLVVLLTAARRSSSGLRLAALVAVAVPFYAWLEQYAATGWFGPALVTLLASYGMHLAAQIEAIQRARRPLQGADIPLVHLTGLGLYAALYVLLEPRYLAWMGAVAALLALANGGLAAALARIERGASAHFLALAFALAAIAVAVEFDGAWVVVGWAAEGGALAWIGVRADRPWLKAGGAFLLVLAIGTLLELLHAPLTAGYTVVLNERAAAGAFVIGVLYALTRPRGGIDGAAGRPQPELAVLPVTANALTLVVLSTEINAFWRLHEAGMGPRGANLAREVTLSVTWAAYAVALVAAGILRRYPPLRYLALTVFGLTALKVFTVDLAQLDRLYRILSIIGLGVLLLVASYLYQRFRTRLAATEERP